MEIPLIVREHQYSPKTIQAWQAVWRSVCDMAYNGTNIQEEIVTTPGYFQVDEEVMTDKIEKDQYSFYKSDYPVNDEELILDHIWKYYSQKAGPSAKLHVVSEFKHLHVPACLFYTLGVESWFAECFPNCKVTFWEH